jgi:predicted metalloprotease with PDZ domain
MTVAVDESQAARRIAFVHEEIPVVSGTVALAYPKWIPGEHGPTGPIQHVADIRIRTGQKQLPWTRDPEDIYTIRVEVPAGVTRITVDFAVLLQNTISDHQLLLSWHTVLLYPLGVDKRDLLVEPSLQLPTGWKFAASLKVTSENGARVAFAPTSLEAIARPANGKISLVVKNFSSVTTYVIDYQGGLQYPHLERIQEVPDYLTSILTARVP